MKEVKDMKDMKEVKMNRPLSITAIVKNQVS
jgi:hypothetical protein